MGIGERLVGGKESQCTLELLEMCRLAQRRWAGSGGHIRHGQSGSDRGRIRVLIDDGVRNMRSRGHKGSWRRNGSGCNRGVTDRGRPGDIPSWRSIGFYYGSHTWEKLHR